MAFLRNIATVLLALLLITIVTVIFVAPEAIMTLFQSIASVNIVIRLVVALVLDLLILAVLYLRLRPTTTESPEGLIVRASGAQADIGINSARSMILAAVKEVPGVYAVDVNLSAVDGKADIELDVRVEGEMVNIPSKQKEIDRALKQVTNKQLGLSILGRPRVHIHLKEDHIIPASPNPAASYIPPVIPPVPAPAPTLSSSSDAASSSDSEGSAMLSTGITAKSAAESHTKPDEESSVESGMDSDADSSSGSDGGIW